MSGYQKIQDDFIDTLVSGFGKINLDSHLLLISRANYDFIINKYMEKITLRHHTDIVYEHETIKCTVSVLLEISFKK